MIKAVFWTTVLTFLSMGAHADFIRGQLDFGGYADYTRDAGAYTEIDFSGAYVMRGTGDFSNIPSIIDDGILTSVSFVDPWSVVATNNFWQVGGFSFDLTNISINDGVTVGGFGIVSHANFDDTRMFWSLTTQNVKYGAFSASTVAEPTALALLGIGLVGLGLVRRRQAA